jgi:hypothetical protein
MNIFVCSKKNIILPQTEAPGLFISMFNTITWLFLVPRCRMVVWCLKLAQSVLAPRARAPAPTRPVQTEQTEESFHSLVVSQRDKSLAGPRRSGNCIATFRIQRDSLHPNNKAAPPPALAPAAASVLRAEHPPSPWAMLAPHISPINHDAQAESLPRSSNADERAFPLLKPSLTKLPIVRRRRLNHRNLSKYCPPISRDKHFKDWLFNAGRPLRSKNIMAQLPSPNETTRPPPQTFTASSQKLTAKSIASVHDTDYRETLEQYNVHVPGKFLSPEFEQEVEKRGFRVRDSPDLDDAYVRKIKQIAISLENAGEEEVRNQLGSHIIPGYTDSPDVRMKAIPGRLWHRTVAIPLDPSVIEQPLPLPKPKPNISLVYTKAAFSRFQLATINLFAQAVNGPSFALPGQDILLPWGAIEFKSAAKDGTLRVATNQAAGAGAVALNGFLEVMSRGPGLDDADLKKALFFSVSIDQNCASINVEWVDKTLDTDQYAFHLQELRMLPIRYGDSIQLLHRALKNIYEYSLNERLKLILDALDIYRDDVTKSKNANLVENSQAEAELHTPLSPPRPPPTKKARGATSKARDETIVRRKNSSYDLSQVFDVR